MKNKIVITKFWLNYYLRCFFSEHKRKFFCCLTIAAVGMLLGILVAIEAIKVLEIPGTDVTINTIEQIKLGSFSLGSLFSKYFFLFLLSVCLVFLTKFFSYLKIVGFLALIILGYQMGCTIIYSCAEYIFSGVICVVVIHIPLFLSLILTSTILYCHATSSFDGAKCSHSISVASIRDLAKKLAILAIVEALFLIIFALLLPSFIKLVIVI